jgi:hypothetical protein
MVKRACQCYRCIARDRQDFQNIVENNFDEFETAELQGLAKEVEEFESLEAREEILAERW